MAGIYRLKASGTIAAADIAVTLTAGSADIDLSSATVPRNYIGYLLKVFDSSERMIQGFVYTNGAGTVQNIVSAKGDSTRNWASQAAGFDDTTNCRYELWKVNNAVQVSTGSVPAGEGKMDTTTANAFAAPESATVPFDFSAFQDGRHLYWAQDSAGKVACAWISGTAPGGETLDVELVTNGDMETGDPPTGWTAGSSTLDGVADERTGGAGAQSIEVQSTAIYADAHRAISSTVVGGHYHATFWGKNVSGNHGAVLINYGAGVYVQTGVLADAAWTEHSLDFTVTNASNVVYLGASQNAYTAGDKYRFDDVSVKRLTDCAATGVLLLSTQGGSRGYMFKDSAFNPNLALTYKIFYVGAD